MRIKKRINVSIPRGVVFSPGDLSFRFVGYLNRIEETPGGVKTVIEERMPYRGVFKYRNSVYVDKNVYEKVKKLASDAGVGMAEITFRVFTIGDSIMRRC